MKGNIFLRALLTLFFAGGLFSIIHAQQQYAGDIAAFKKADSSIVLKEHPIVFAGSSSFTKWTDVQQYFPDKFIINRGFGGSTLQDVLYYANDVILKYLPKQVVIYCGENDLAYSDSVTPLMVLERFKLLFNKIRQQLPRVSIAFISIKPSISRERLMPEIETANQLIKKYLTRKKRTAFINVYNAMLGEDGKPLPDIFIADKLHMNAKGYAIWQKIIEPYLL